VNFEWLQGISPRWGAVLHAIAWLLIVIWVWRKPASEVLEGAPDRAPWRDLRWWVVPLAAVQVALYLWF
jgi:hypothetical protein